MIATAKDIDAKEAPPETISQLGEILTVFVLDAMERCNACLECVEQLSHGLSPDTGDAKAKPENFKVAMQRAKSLARAIDRCALTACIAALPKGLQEVFNDGDRVSRELDTLRECVAEGDAALKVMESMLAALEVAAKGSGGGAPSSDQLKAVLAALGGVKNSAGSNRRLVRVADVFLDRRSPLASPIMDSCSSLVVPESASTLAKQL